MAEWRDDRVKKTRRSQTENARMLHHRAALRG
jgi:hypothetical protein